MAPSRADEIARLEAKIAELESRWPSHSVPPRMWQELEELESTLEQLRAASAGPETADGELHTKQGDRQQDATQGPRGEEV